MIQRISRKKFKIYALDIETHNDDESIGRQETSMWLGCFIDETNTVEQEESYFYNMNELFDKLEIMTNGKRHKSEENRPIKNVCIYIYNASFEWSFMLPVLLERGFKPTIRITQESEYNYCSVSTKSCSSVWEVQLKFGKKNGIVLIRDMAKTFGGGLKKVAQAFELPTQKGEINYRLNRLHNHIITKEEKEYCFKDTRILIDILLKMQEKNDKEFFNTMSMASYSMKHLIKTGYPRSIYPYKEFRKRCPELSAEENEFLRKGVSGGITYAPSMWQFKDIKQKILHIDAHQMHPSQAYLRRFPYGYGEYHKGKPTKFYGYINACRIRISYYAVKLHSVIQLIGLDFIDDYELVVWDFEIPTMKKCYVGLEIEYIDYYQYRAGLLPWRKYYKHNYDERLKAKARGDAFYTLYYKLLNNSSYGKLLEKPHNEYLQNIINEEGIIDSHVIPKEKEELRSNAKYTYLPVGSAIPAYSRVMLIETALLFGYKKVLYFDTDSIFVLYDEETKKIWESDLIDKQDHLGGWGLEEISDRAQFTAPKRYKLETNNKVVIKAGGINFSEYISRKAKEKHIKPQDYAVSFDEINIISSKWKVQRAYRCKGGTLIEFQEKEISVPRKYEEIFKKNYENDI